MARNRAHRQPRPAGLLVAPLAAALLLFSGCGDDPITRVAPGFMEADKRLEDMEGDTTGIETTIQEFNAAFDGQDLAALQAHFTEVAEIYLDDGRVVRADGLEAELSAVWSGWTNIQTTYHLKGVKIARPWAWAKYTETVSHDEGGETRSRDNLVTMTFEKRGERWFITHMHISSVGLDGPSS